MTPSADAVQPRKVTTKPDGSRTIEVDLIEALRLSLANNQQWLARTENLDLQLLSLEVLRRSWWPLPTPLTGNVSWGDSKDSDPASSQGLSAGVSQKLPWGGSSASVTASTSGNQGIGPNFYSSTVTAGFNLPLFRGGGWRLGVEDKVAAERGYAYTRRDFEYARIDLLIQTIQSFFGQLQQQKAIGNFERALANAKLNSERSALQFGRGLVSQNDVIQAELAVSNAENSLVNGREQARLQLDSFKIDLGLRPEDEVILVEEEINYQPLDIDLNQAIESAFATNPTWLNAKDQFDDAGRDLEIARNATMPVVNVGANYTWAQLAEDRPFTGFETGSSGIGVSASFAIDLDRSSINQAYQAAVVGYRQRERAFQRARDEMVRSTQSQLTSLKQAEITMRIQDKSRGEAKRSLELEQEQYERGTSRDNLRLIQARDQLVAAENSYLLQKLTAKVLQLKLLQWMGRLQPDEEGRWVR
jgi:outer membrane protein TolC